MSHNKAPPYVSVVAPSEGIDPQPTAPMTASSSPRSESAEGSDSQSTAHLQPRLTPPHSTSTIPSSGSARKRVFTFQKRWLHSLPIMEKTLPESAVEGGEMGSLKVAASQLVGDDGKPIEGAAAREVIVCMLCDDPNSNREVLKVWSRLNCRRGRIENHLMSKHPEFMLLLKQKRDTEGELAVQIFLQNMREGRCNVRSEISAGLYSHMQAMPSPAMAPPPSTTSTTTTGTMDAMSNKRPYVAVDDFAGGANIPYGTATAKSLGFAQMLVARDSVDELDEQRRKRAKPPSENDMGTMAASPNGHMAAPRQPIAPFLTSFPTQTDTLAQFRTVLVNKTIVVTGGETPSMVRLATNFWLMGANVAVTFSDPAAIASFADYMVQLHASEPSDTPRGSLTPLFCQYSSRAQIEEWSRTVKKTCSQVDFLINYVADDDDGKKTSNDEVDSSDQSERPKVSTDEGASSSSMNRVLELCQAIAALCIRPGGRTSIVNVTTETNDVRTSMNCAALEALTRSLSSELQSKNVQVNTILLQHQQMSHSEGFSETTDERPQSHEPTEQENMELLHTMLFLLSQASACISGSILRLRSPSVARSSVDTTSDTTLQPASETAVVSASPEQRQLV